MTTKEDAENLAKELRNYLLVEFPDAVMNPAKQTADARHVNGTARRIWKLASEIGIFAPLRPGAWSDGVIDLVLHDAVAREIWVLDWKTNRRRPGETDAALLARLVEEYTPQLSAYGECLAGFFPGCRVRQLVFSSVAGVGSDMGGVKF